MLCGTKYTHERTGAGRGTLANHPPSSWNAAPSTRAISAPTALVGGLLSLIASGVWLASPIQESKPHFSFLFLWLAVFTAHGWNQYLVHYPRREEAE